MRRLINLTILTVFMAVAGLGQQKVVHFKKLQEFLPTAAVKDFKREKPTGTTQTAMGMSTSEASVRFTRTVKEMQEMEDEAGKKRKEEVDVTHEITIKISDMSAMPFAVWAMAFQQQDYENETEEGHEKSTTVKEAYKGVEKVQSGSYRSCQLQFSVGSRFLVEANGSGTDDVKLLYTFVESMDLAKLEKTVPDKK